MSARLVAESIGALMGEPWMPRVSHWEIATTDDVWGAHAELDCQTSGPAFRELHALADTVRSEVTGVSDHLTAVDFTYDEVPVRVWWLRPVLRWIVPPTCATCPTKLGGVGVAFVRLGVGDREAPVICVPCRDRMQAQWVGQSRELAVSGAVLSPGGYLRMRAALDVVHAARRQHGEAVVPLVRALENAGLLRSPESAPAEAGPAFPWARLLSEADRAEFLNALGEAAITLADTSTALGLVEERIAHWRTTALVGAPDGEPTVVGEPRG